MGQQDIPPTQRVSLDGRYRPCSKMIDKVNLTSEDHHLMMIPASGCLRRATTYVGKTSFFMTIPTASAKRL